jgi:hypothetical protein
MRRIGVVLVAVVLGGCGGGGGPAAARPQLPHALGAQLAAQADAVQASLARGDSCAALGQAGRLRQMVASAIAAGQVPGALRQPLSSSAEALAGEIVCTPAPPRPRKDHRPGKRPGHDHGDGHDHGPGHDHGGKD